MEDNDESLLNSNETLYCVEYHRHEPGLKLYYRLIYVSWLPELQVSRNIIVIYTNLWRCKLNYLLL
jgi:hypothetical protein